MHPMKNITLGIGIAHNRPETARTEAKRHIPYRPRQCLAARLAWTSTHSNPLADRGLGLACELERLASGRFTHKLNRQLAKHLLGHAVYWIWFLIDPTIDATNYRGEQAIRPAIVNRKVWDGNRTWQGAPGQGILTSMIRACERRSPDAFDFLTHALRRPTPQLLPEWRGKQARKKINRIPRDPEPVAEWHAIIGPLDLDRPPSCCRATCASARSAAAGCGHRAPAHDEPKSASSSIHDAPWSWAVPAWLTARFSSPNDPLWEERIRQIDVVPRPKYA